MGRLRRRGFALVVSLSLLVLLTVLAVGLLGLSAVVLRGSGVGSEQARARENARLAMVMALGELQRHAGADTRATAAAAVLDEKDGFAHPHWTGVWSSRAADGGPLWVRDDAGGGLRDARVAGGAAEQRVLSWLVSGREAGVAANPRVAEGGEWVEVVGDGTVGKGELRGEVRVPRVGVRGVGGVGGHYAWWVGDLGVKANVGTPDAFEDKEPDPALPEDGGWYRWMVAQEADASALGAGERLVAGAKRRFASERTPGVVEGVGSEKMRRHFHDFTVHSEGLLTDAAEGGLKRNLTAYFASGGKVEDWRGLPGLADSDNLVGPANAAAAERQGLRWNELRHRFTSPKFGLLRRWAGLGAPFRGGGEVAALPPKVEPSPRVGASKDLALANLAPASIASADSPGLSPVLVEGSLYYNMSYHQATPRPGQTVARHPYQVRLHVYPRIVLWNPYNVSLTMDRAMAMIQGNGRQEMWTDGYMMRYGMRMNVTAQWIWFEGGRSTDFSPANGSILDSKGYTDPYMGCWYFSLPRTTFGPGECLVFSPERSAEYNRPVGGSRGGYNLEANSLTCAKAPHPSRSYYTSDSEIDGGIDFVPTHYWFAPTTAWGAGGIRNQGDDCRVVLKHLGNRTGITFEEFDALPQVSLLSASLQYGGGREPRIAWSLNEKMVVEETGSTNVASQPLKIPPNVRTREGIRLRWIDEHLSNLEGSGSLKGTPHFEDALLANWNPRAAYATRSPFENIGGSMPASGSQGGPWFFGAYTRDLYDVAVSWEDQMPVARGGRYHGNPFGPPQESGGRPIVLFDLPRAGAGVVSIGQLQHAKLSEFIWHPSYAVGNSLVDPRLASGRFSGLDRTAPKYAGVSETQKGGFDAAAIGWSSDTQRSANRESWAAQARAIYQDYPVTDNLVYDLSFELNHSLWDGYFLATGNRADHEAFCVDPVGSPLPNGRMRLAPGGGGRAAVEDLGDYHRAAARLSVEGAFNVNSTRVEAWKAVLGATRRVTGGDEGQVAFPRVLHAPGGQWQGEQGTDDEAAWSGTRVLTEEEVDRLARAVVVEVRKRGPFLTVADFVNRRLANDETGRMGAMQAAIEAAGINRAFKADYPLDNGRSLGNYRHPDSIQDATRFEQTLKPDCKVWGIPGYLTQADVLQVIGPQLGARSDSFIIRTYGDATDGRGVVVARAWCEAVVQRCPEPLEADASGLNPLVREGKPDFGRRFIVKSFRWLRPEEV